MTVNYFASRGERSTNRLFCIILVLIIPIRLVAQSQSSSSRWELGVDVLSPFKNIQLDRLNSTYGLILKRPIKNDRAIRARIDLGLDYMPDPIIKGTNQPREFATSFDIGIEKQNQNGRFVHFFGFDTMFRYGRLNSTVSLGVTPGSNISYSQNKGRIISSGVSCFTGGKYYITNQLSLSLESTAVLYYSTIRENSTDYITGNPPIIQSFSTINTNGLIFKIYPVSTLYLSYHF